MNNFVHTQHIGSAVCLSGNTGLGTIMTDLLQNPHRLLLQFTAKRFRQQLHLIKATLHLPQTADGYPSEDIKSLRIFLPQFFRKQSAVNLSIASSVTEFIAQHALPGAAFVMPQRHPTVNEWQLLTGYGTFRCIDATIAAQIPFSPLQNPFAQNAFGWK